MTTFFMVCFDVSDKRRLRRVSNELENFGIRVQRSVFECRLDDSDFNDLKKRLLKLIDEEQDHVRYYKLCSKDTPCVLIQGLGEVTTDPDYHLF